MIDDAGKLGATTARSWNTEAMKYHTVGTLTCCMYLHMQQHFECAHLHTYTWLTPAGSGGNYSATAFRNAQPLALYFRSLFPVIFEPQTEDRQKNYPNCPLISPENIFPRRERLPSFLSSLSPAPPLINVKWFNRETLISTTILVGLARGSLAKAHFLLYLLHPSIFNSPLMPSHQLPPTLFIPRQPRGCGGTPSPSQGNFPVEIKIIFSCLKCAHNM